MYLSPTAVKGTCELRKENHRLTWEKDLPWFGHSSSPAEKQPQPVVLHFSVVISFVYHSVQRKSCDIAFLLITECIDGSMVSVSRQN